MLLSTRLKDPHQNVALDYVLLVTLLFFMSKPHITADEPCQKWWGFSFHIASGYLDW